MISRRQILAGALALAAIGWSDALAAPSASAKRVATAYNDALRLGRYLLVFVVPSDPTWMARYVRQHAFGSLLTYADDDVRSRLGSAVLVAASAAELAEIVPQAAALGEPLLVLVDPGVFPASVRALDTALLPIDYGRGATDDGAADANIQRLSRLILDALPRAPVAWDGKPPAGSSFWLSYGCGEWPEDPAEDTVGGGYDCGMGFVPDKSQRFLHFFTEVEP